MLNLRTMGTVTSILNVPYILPRFQDRRGKKVVLSVPIRNRTGAKCIVDLEGQETVLGLILHRTPNGEQRSISSLRKWTISEPVTGLRITFGRTRQDAIDGIAQLVAFYGGEQEFKEILAHSVEQSQATG